MDAAEPTAIDYTQGQVHAGTHRLIDNGNTQMQLGVVETHRLGDNDNTQEQVDVAEPTAMITLKVSCMLVPSG